MTEPAREPRHYAKPIVLPESLSCLRGPSTGIVKLPRHLKWSGSNRYDLDQPGRIIDLYRTVINEAMTPEDLATFLNQGALLDLWGTIWLPPRIRAAWEQRFPELTRFRETGRAA
jgi:hypothetical protein